jgi:hypothetical protein
LLYFVRCLCAFFVRFINVVHRRKSAMLTRLTLILHDGVGDGAVSGEIGRSLVTTYDLEKVQEEEHLLFFRSV